MKSIKRILVLLITISFINCNDSDNSPSYPLNYENIAGLYGIESLKADVQTTISVSGIPVTASANAVGDTFQVDMIINADRTYSINGEYRIITTTRIPGTSPLTEEEIVVVDEDGTYVINENSINFTDPNAEFLTGVLNVTVFNEDSFTLAQELEESDSSTNTSVSADLAVGFIRK